MFKVIQAILFVFVLGGIVSCSSSTIEEEQVFPVDLENLGEMDSMVYFKNEFLHYPSNLTPDIPSIPEEKIHISSLSDGISFSLIQRNKKKYEEWLKSYHPTEKDVLSADLKEGIESFQDLKLKKNGEEVRVVLDTISAPGLPNEFRWRTYKVKNADYFLLTVRCSEKTVSDYQNAIHYSIQQFHFPTKVD